jgi:uncharacterized integral membrane protein
MTTISSTATLYVLRMVFSNRFYAALAITAASGFWVIFNVLDGLLFFSPVVNFYYPLPGDSVPGFILSNITAALVGIVIAMNVYIFRNYKVRRLGKSFFSGSALGTFSSMCASCSSVGFFVATMFGSAGIAASSFMSNYQFPLRLVAVGLLIWAYYSAQRRITASCMINR